MDILLIEDDDAIADFIQMEITHEGYGYERGSTGSEGLRLALSRDFDLILLDVMLPEMNGYEVLRRLRAQKNTPVIMLTARDSVIDKVMGLDAGANDYVTKPFHIEELLARIRACTRKGAHGNEDILTNGDVVLDRVRHLVTRGGKPCTLTKTQFALLEYFLINHDIVLSREQLLSAVWGYSYTGESNIVDVYVRYLRSKLNEPADGKLIESVRGIGYVMRTKQEQ